MTERASAEVATLVGIQRTEHPVPHRLTCRILGVSEPWFYKRRDRPIPAREVRRGLLADEVRRICTGSGGLAGVGEHHREADGRTRTGWTGVAQSPGLTGPGERAVDFVRRDFTAEAPDLVWAGDMTEVVTGRESCIWARSSIRPAGASDALDDQLIGQLVDRAKADGIKLTGQGGFEITASGGSFMERADRAPAGYWQRTGNQLLPAGK